jgi:thioredoxin-related protein
MRYFCIVLFLVLSNFGCSERDKEYSMMLDYFEKNGIVKFDKDLIIIYNLEGCYSCINSLNNLQTELSANLDIGAVMVGADIHQIRKNFNNDIVLFTDKQKLIQRYYSNFSNGIIVELNNKKLINIKNEQEVSNYRHSL